MQALEVSGFRGGELGLDVAALWTKVQTILAKGEKYVDTVFYIVEDPALPQIVEQINELHKLEAAKAAPAPADAVPDWAKIPMPGDKPAAPAKPAGIGLNKVVAPLKLYVKFRKNPALGYAVVGGALLVLVGVGFGLGWAVKPSKKSVGEPAKTVGGAGEIRRRRRA